MGARGVRHALKNQKMLCCDLAGISHLHRSFFRDEAILDAATSTMRTDICTGEFQSSTPIAERHCCILRRRTKLTHHSLQYTTCCTCSNKKVSLTNNYPPGGLARTSSTSAGQAHASVHQLGVGRRTWTAQGAMHHYFLHTAPFRMHILLMHPSMDFV
jgi:hypothetical protein